MELSPIYFKIKCHTLYCQELLHALFLKARLGDLHTNFPIKSLSKGKDSCHADRQLTKQFYCFFFSEEESEKNKEKSTGKSQFPVPHTHGFKILLK